MTSGTTDPAVFEFPGHPLADWQEDVTAGRTTESYRQWARQREAGLTDAEADVKATCRNCSETLHADEDNGTCDSPGANTREDGDDELDDDEGEHEPDVVLSDVPASDPVTYVRLDLVVGVPNDGYEYFSDIQGRIERFADRLLEDRLITTVSTRGQSGSGFVEVLTGPFA